MDYTTICNEIINVLNKDTTLNRWRESYPPCMKSAKTVDDIKFTLIGYLHAKHTESQSMYFCNRLPVSESVINSMIEIIESQTQKTMCEIDTFLSNEEPGQNKHSDFLYDILIGEISIAMFMLYKHYEELFNKLSGSVSMTFKEHLEEWDLGYLPKANVTFNSIT
jgi:hypothetical protein